MRKGPTCLSLELGKDLVKSDRKSQAFRAQDRGLGFHCVGLNGSCWGGGHRIFLLA